jgi:hypothetical protein
MDAGLDFRQFKVFLFSTASRLTSRRTQSEVDPSPPSSAEAKNDGAIYLTSPFVFMGQCLTN